MDDRANYHELPIIEPTRSLPTDVCLADKPRPKRPAIDQPKPYSSPLFGYVEDDLTWFAFFYGIEIGVLVGMIIWKLFTLECV